MKVYNYEKYYRMIRVKQMIYSNQLKRLSVSSKRANFILIYYSIALIIYTLALRYFNHLMHQDFTEFSSIVISIMILIYSIISSNSRFSERAHDVEFSLNQIKRMKRKLANIPSMSYDEQGEEFEDFKEKYEDLIDNVEYRDDLDFYYTVKYFCKKFNINFHTGKLQVELNVKDHPSLNVDRETLVLFIDEIQNYIKELDPKMQLLNIWIRRIWHAILYTAPVIIFIICLILNDRNIIINFIKYIFCIG